MFEKELKKSLLQIFDLKKATLDLPGESQEQECLFIEVENCISRVSGKMQSARVTGRIRVFANSDKLPYGYFAKKIHESPIKFTKDFFFFDFEENAGTFLNITERSLSFIYFYSSQYDPAQGSIGSITTEQVGQ